MIINAISSTNKYINFQARTYSERLSERLSDMGWWERNFGGGTTESKEAVEEEMRDEIDYNWRRVGYAKDSIQHDKSNYKSEISRINNRIKEVNSEISEHRTLHPFQTIKIKTLQAQAYAQGIITDISNKAEERLSEKIDKKRDQSYELSSQANSIERDLRTIKIENDFNIRTKIAELKEKALIEHGKEIEKLINAPILYLKQNVLMPMKMIKAGKEFSMPNGILINTPLKTFSKLILRWITKNTNSNYAKINAKNFKTEEEFFEKLNSVSELAQNEHNKTGSHTFTLITNIEKFVNEKRTSLVPYLKNFMDTTAQDHFNTIILSSKKAENLDSILTAKHRFPLKINLSSKFLFMRKYGFLSMLFGSFKSGTVRKNLNSKKLFH